MNEDEDLPSRHHNNPPIAELLPIEFAKFIEKTSTLNSEADKLTKIDNEDDLELAIEMVKRCRTAASTADEKRKERNRPLDEDIKSVNNFFRNIAATPQGHVDRITGLVGKYKQDKAEAEKRIAAERAARLEEEARIRKEGASEMTGVMKEVLENEAERRQAEADVNAGHARDSKLGPTKTSTGTAGERRTIQFRVKDGTKIPLAKLKGHFDLAALEKAIRSFVKTHNKVSKELPELPGVEFYFDDKTVIR